MPFVNCTGLAQSEKYRVVFLTKQMRIDGLPHPSLLALAFVQFDQFLDGGRILWLFICVPEGDQAGKPQYVTRLCPDFPCRMDRRERPSRR